MYNSINLLDNFLNKSKFILGIPTNNRHSKINELITKINSWTKNNKLNNLENIIIADNSKIINNDCLEICNDNNFKYIWDGKNHGYGGNIRRLCLASKGFHLWLLGDDDEVNEKFFLQVNDYFNSGSISKYITFSSVTDSFKSNDKKDGFPQNSQRLRIKSETFLNKEWPSVIFVSANIMYISKEDHAKFQTQKISQIYENSVLAFSIIRNSKYVDILKTFDLKDSFTEKLYYPEDRFWVSVIGWFDVIDSLLEKNVSKKLKYDLNNIFMSKYLSALKYSIFFQLHKYNSNTLESLYLVNCRLKKSKLDNTNPYIIYYLMYLIYPFIIFVPKIIGFELISKILSIFIGKKIYREKYNKFIKVLNSKGMSYMPD